MTDYKPEGSPDILAFLVVKDPRKTIAFAESVLGAQLVSEPLLRGNGQIWNAEMHLGDSRFYISGADGPFEMPGFLYVYVEDCDATYARAIDHGADPVTPPDDRFYGARDGGVSDANGTMWWFATHQETVDGATLQERAAVEEARRKGG